VAGIAAAICRRCYLALKEGKLAVAVDLLIGGPNGAQLRALQRSRAARLRERHEYERLGRAFRSLQPKARQTRGATLLTRQALAKWSVQSHLDLVISREHVRGRPALKFPNGRRPLYPFVVTAD